MFCLALIVAASAISALPLDSAVCDLLSQATSTVTRTDDVNLDHCIANANTINSNQYFKVTSALLVIDSCQFNSISFQAELIYFTGTALSSCFLLHSSFTNLILAGNYGTTVKIEGQVLLTQIIDVKFNTASGTKGVFAITPNDAAVSAGAQVSIIATEVSNVTSPQGSSMIDVQVGAPVLRDISLLFCTADTIFKLAKTTQRTEITNCLFESTSFSQAGNSGGIIASSTTDEVIFTNCRFINSSAGMAETVPLYCVGCSFTSGGHPDSFGVSTTNPAPTSLSNCRFEGLAVGIATRGDPQNGKNGLVLLQVCDCSFTGCGQGILGTWLGVVLVHSSFVDIDREAVAWQIRASRIAIDGCFFAAPKQAGAVTLSFTASGGTRVEGQRSSIMRSCFLGSGQRIAFASGLDEIQITINASACFASDNPFGSEHDNVLWNPTTSCTECDGLPDIGEVNCGGYGFPPPQTPLLTPPNIPGAFTLPPATPEQSAAPPTEVKEATASEAFEASEGFDESASIAPSSVSASDAPEDSAVLEKSSSFAPSSISVSEPLVASFVLSKSQAIELSSVPVSQVLEDSGVLDGSSSLAPSAKQVDTAFYSPSRVFSGSSSLQPSAPVDASFLPDSLRYGASEPLSRSLNRQFTEALASTRPVSLSAALEASGVIGKSVSIAPSQPVNPSSSRIGSASPALSAAFSLSALYEASRAIPRSSEAVGTVPFQVSATSGVKRDRSATLLFSGSSPLQETAALIASQIQSASLLSRGSVPFGPSGLAESAELSASQAALVTALYSISDPFGDSNVARASSQFPASSQFVGSQSESASVLRVSNPIAASRSVLSSAQFHPTSQIAASARQASGLPKDSDSFRRTGSAVPSGVFSDSGSFSASLAFAPSRVHYASSHFAFTVLLNASAKFHPTGGFEGKEGATGGSGTSIAAIIGPLLAALVLGALFFLFLIRRRKAEDQLAGLGEGEMDLKEGRDSSTFSSDDQFVSEYGFSDRNGQSEEHEEDENEDDDGLDDQNSEGRVDDLGESPSDGSGAGRPSEEGE
jgi:hypothetical protein